MKHSLLGNFITVILFVVCSAAYAQMNYIGLKYEADVRKAQSEILTFVTY